MSFNVFVSYRFSDAKVARTVTTFFDKYGGGGHAPGTPEFVHVKRPTNEKDIETRIRDVMRTCHALVVIVGDDGHNGPWIEHEIDAARGRKLPIVAMRLPGCTAGLPQRLRNSSDVQVVDWSPAALAQALNRILSGS